MGAIGADNAVIAKAGAENETGTIRLIVLRVVVAGVGLGGDESCEQGEDDDSGDHSLACRQVGAGYYSFVPVFSKYG